MIATNVIVKQAAKIERLKGMIVTKEEYEAYRHVMFGGSSMLKEGETALSDKVFAKLQQQTHKEETHEKNC